MDCKNKIDAALQRIAQYLNDEHTIVPPPGWLTGGAIDAELAIIKQESTHLMEVIDSTMNELTARERELLKEKYISVSMHLPARARC